MPHIIRDVEFKFNLGCYKCHEIKFISYLRYHGINRASSIYGVIIKTIHDIYKGTYVLCMFILCCGFLKLL